MLQQPARLYLGLGMAAGIVGILVIEAVLIGLYLAYFHRRITGDKQKIAAAATAGLGFVLSCLGIVGDSQMMYHGEHENAVRVLPLIYGLALLIGKADSRARIRQVKHQRKHLSFISSDVCIIAFNGYRVDIESHNGRADFKGNL